MTIRIGTVLKGYCGGYFGRDSYEDKRVESIGFDWVVCRGLESESPCFAEGENLINILEEYKNDRS